MNPGTAPIARTDSTHADIPTAPTGITRSTSPPPIVTALTKPEVQLRQPASQSPSSTSRLGLSRATATQQHDDIGPRELALAKQDIEARIAALEGPVQGSAIRLPALAEMHPDAQVLDFESLQHLVGYLQAVPDRPGFIIASVGAAHAAEVSIATVRESEGGPPRTSVVLHDPNATIPALRRYISALARQVDAGLFVGSFSQRGWDECHTFAVQSVGASLSDSRRRLDLHAALLAGRHPQRCLSEGRHLYAVADVPASGYLGAKHYKYTQALPELRQRIVAHQSRLPGGWQDARISKSNVPAGQYLAKEPMVKNIAQKTERYTTRGLAYLKKLQAEGDAGARTWFADVNRLQPCVDENGHVQGLPWVQARQKQELDDVVARLNEAGGDAGPDVFATLAKNVCRFQPEGSLRAVRLLTQYRAAAFKPSPARDKIVDLLCSDQALLHPARMADFGAYWNLLKHALDGVDDTKLLDVLLQKAPGAAVDFALMTTTSLARITAPMKHEIVRFCTRQFDRLSAAQKEDIVRMVERTLYGRKDMLLELLEKLVQSPDIGWGPRGRALVNLQSVTTETGDRSSLRRIETLVAEHRSSSALDRLRESAPEELARLDAAVALVNRTLGLKGAGACDAFGLYHYLRLHGVDHSREFLTEMLASATGGKHLSYANAQALYDELSSREELFALIELDETPYFLAVGREAPDQRLKRPPGSWRIVEHDAQLGAELGGQLERLVPVDGDRRINVAAYEFRKLNVDQLLEMWQAGHLATDYGGA